MAAEVAHDIWWLALNFPFDGRTLARAIAATYERRGTAVPAHPTALLPRFSADPSKAAQWRAFPRRLAPTDCPEDFAAVGKEVARFLQPVVAAISRGAGVRAGVATPRPVDIATIKTVGTHREHVMAKLDIHSIAGLTKYAIREGLTSSAG